jgi:putative hemolysin
MVNPAAFYCQQLGYPCEIVRTENGERSIVQLPGGLRCDAWDFYRGKVGQEHSWCVRQGYGIATRTRNVNGYEVECAVCLDAQGGELAAQSEMMGLANQVFASDLTGSQAPRTGDPVQSRQDLPAAFDWRDLGGCTSIKDQGSCGSCWAFGTVGPLECNILIKDGLEVDLSEQWLVSCNQDGWSCGGGWWAHSYHEWKADPCGDSGAVMERDFPYAAADLPCDCPYPHAYWIDEWVYIGEAWSVPAAALIKQAILDHGPVSVAVSVNSAFSGYSGGIFHDPNTGSLNHAVALVGWDDNQGPEGVWFLRNSWGTDWGEDGYMRITYGSRSVGYNACYVDYRDPLQMSLLAGVPETIPAGEDYSLDVRIVELADSMVDGSAQIHYRFDGGAFSSGPLANFAGDLYQAILPSAGCDDRPEFYFSADATAYGTVLYPAGAPASLFVSHVGSPSDSFTDDFEDQLGWSVQNDPSLTDGAWQRGVPVGGGDRGDPPSDFDGSGICYLTDNVDDNSDVDGGITWLISPAFELDPDSQYLVHYALWYTNCWGNDPNNDLFNVHVSANGGASWVLAESIGRSSDFGWVEHCFLLNDFVTPSSQVHVRFEASDLEDGSVVEAGIDDFALRLLGCDVATGISGPLPYSSALYPTVPNPFNPQAAIRYRLNQAGPVRLAIFDLAGNRVCSLLNGQVQAAGEHTVSWDGRSDRGEKLASGVYLCRLLANGAAMQQKLTLLK